MNMKGLIAATLVVIVPASLHAQEPLIPQNFLQTAPEAYYHYEPNVLECVEWLTETPLEADNGTLGKMTLSPRGLSDEDRTAGATRAIEYSIAFYDRNRDLLGRNGKLERLKKMQEKGTLRQYVEANLYRPDDK